MTRAEGLGVVLRDSREARGLSQTQLAEQLGLDRGWSQRKISLLEAGKQTTHLDEVEEIARVLGRDALEMVKEAFERSDRSISE